MEYEYPATTAASIVVIQGKATKARPPGITRWVENMCGREGG
jgi:hypothetical protein